MNSLYWMLTFLAFKGRDILLNSILQLSSHNVVALDKCSAQRVKEEQENDD